MKTIAILIFDGCMTSSVTGPLDLFNISNTLWQRFHPESVDTLFNPILVSIDGKPVIGSSGIELTPKCSLDELSSIDLLMIGGFQYESDQGLIKHIQRLSPIHQHLHTLLTNGCVISSFCTGTFILAEAGILKNSRATTSWWLEQLFNQRYQDIDLVMDQLVVTV